MNNTDPYITAIGHDACTASKIVTDKQSIRSIQRRSLFIIL